MVEKNKKPGLKPKAKAATAVKQKTLFDMFPMKEDKGFGKSVASDEPVDVTTLDSEVLHEVSGGMKPIVIEETPPPAPSPSSAPPSSPISLIEIDTAQGSSPSAPIVIDSSPVRPSLVSSGSKTFHPFFAPRVTHKRSVPSATPSTSKTYSVPYPDKFSQHVKGPQTIASSSANPYSRRASVISSTSNHHLSPSSYNFLSSISNTTPNEGTYKYSREASLPQIGNVVEVIPKEHALRHPCIARAMDQANTDPDSSRSHSKSEAWTEKWRPRSADEVLGNEDSARYLRSWLLALKLQAEGTNGYTNDRSRTANAKSNPIRAKKRPRIIKEVARERTRKRAKIDDSDEDDWIAFSDEEAEDFLSFTDAEVDPTLSLSSTRLDPTQSTPREVIQDLGKLHNTILLTGPPGAGKTASVYACAEELGWEVFEVYPGIGKRNSSNVEHLVGDVGKNHLVRHRPQGGNDFFTVGSPTKRKVTLKHLSETEHDEDESSSRETEVKGNHPQNSSDDQPPLAQSLILLEEVDILFKEDTNFWPTVIKIIKECKRPVICTCNDTSLVPLVDLPIQKILNFEPCSPDITVSYLQSLTYVEGRPMGREGLERLLESRRSILEEPESWGRTQPGYDLRHAINLLQVFTHPPQLGSATVSLDKYVVPGNSSNRPRKVPADGHNILMYDKEKSLGHWKAAAHEADVRSVLDSHLASSAIGIGIPSIEEMYMPSDDDEMGHTILFDTRTGASFPITYQVDSQIRLAVKEHLQGRVDDQSDMMEWEAKTSAKAERFKADLGHVLHDVCPQAVWKTPLPHLFTDYAPYIKQIAEADDAQAEATIQRVQERGGRRTRNSGKTEYVRTLILSDLGRSSISRICFEG